MILLDFQIPCSRPETPGFCLLTKHEDHGSWTKSRALMIRMGTRDSMIQDGEDVDVLRSLDQGDLHQPTNKSETDLEIVCTSLFPVLVKTFKLIHF